MVGTSSIETVKLKKKIVYSIICTNKYVEFYVFYLWFQVDFSVCRSIHYLGFS